MGVLTPVLCQNQPKQPLRKVVPNGGFTPRVLIINVYILYIYRKFMIERFFGKRNRSETENETESGRGTTVTKSEVVKKAAISPSRTLSQSTDFSTFSDDSPPGSPLRNDSYHTPLIGREKSLASQTSQGTDFILNKSDLEEDSKQRVNAAYQEFKRDIKDPKLSMNVKLEFSHYLAGEQSKISKVIAHYSFSPDELNLFKHLCHRRYRREVKKSKSDITRLAGLGQLESQLSSASMFEPRNMQEILNGIIEKFRLRRLSLFGKVNKIVIPPALQPLFRQIELYASLIDGGHDFVTMLLIEDAISMGELGLLKAEIDKKNIKLLLFDGNWCPKKAAKDLNTLCIYGEEKLRAFKIGYAEEVIKVFLKGELDSTEVKNMFEPRNNIYEAGRKMIFDTVFDSMMWAYDMGSRTGIGHWRTDEQYKLENVYGVDVYIQPLAQEGIFKVITSYNYEERTYFIEFIIGDEEMKGVSLNDVIGLFRLYGINNFNSAIRNGANPNPSHISFIGHGECDTTDFQQWMNSYTFYPNKINMNGLFVCDESWYKSEQMLKYFQTKVPHGMKIFIKLVACLKGAGDASNDVMFKGGGDASNDVMFKGGGEKAGQVPSWAEGVRRNGDPIAGLENAISTNDTYLNKLLRLKYLLGSIDTHAMTTLQTAETAIVTMVTSGRETEIKLNKLAFILYLLEEGGKMLTLEHAKQRMTEIVKKRYGLDQLEAVYSSLEPTPKFEEIIKEYLNQFVKEKLDHVEGWINKVWNVRDSAISEDFKYIITHPVFENLDFNLSLSGLYEIIGEYDQYMLSDIFKEVSEVPGTYFTPRRSDTFVIYERPGDDHIYLRVQNNTSQLEDHIFYYNSDIDSEAYTDEDKILIEIIGSIYTYIGMKPSIELYTNLKNIIEDLWVTEDPDKMLPSWRQNNVEGYFNRKIAERKALIMGCPGQSGGGKTKKGCAKSTFKKGAKKTFKKGCAKKTFKKGCAKKNRKTFKKDNL